MHYRALIGSVRVRKSGELDMTDALREANRRRGNQILNGLAANRCLDLVCYLIPTQISLLLANLDRPITGIDGDEESRPPGAKRDTVVRSNLVNFAVRPVVVPANNAQLAHLMPPPRPALTPIVRSMCDSARRLTAIRGLIREPTL